jgi:nucleoside-diphosphate-sugar epimerase
MMIKDKKILVTGPTGGVARPIALELARANQVWGAARFTDPALRAELEAAGVRTFTWSLGQDDFTGLPDDFDYVIHSACNIFPVMHDYEGAVRTNAEGTGLLIAHCRKMKALLYVSSMQIYSSIPDNGRPRKEDEALGCHASYAPAYSISKVATEAVARTLARIFGIPTIIARLGMNYGPGTGGAQLMAVKAMLAEGKLKVPPRGVSYCSPIHNAEVIEQIEPLLAAASVPATIVNWVGDEGVDERELLEYMAEVAGIHVQFEEDPAAGYRGGVGDPARRIAITGPSRRLWREGHREMLKANFPELGL